MIGSKLAIGIIAYNRPHYLKWLLHSLENQINPGNVDYHFFIDGSKGLQDRKKIKECTTLWKIANLKNKFLHQRVKNVGTATNIFEAKNALADEYDYFIISEDDFLLSKYAVRLMRKLGSFIDDDIFSASMSFVRLCSKSDLDKNKNLAKVITNQHWWFELYRSKNWKKIKPSFELYYEIVKGKNYRMRDRDQIIELFKSNGFYEEKTSQDAGMDFALFLNHQKRITFLVNRGLYLGEVGEHFTKEVADKYHFNDQTPYQFTDDERIELCLL